MSALWCSISKYCSHMLMMMMTLYIITQTLHWCCRLYVQPQVMTNKSHLSPCWIRWVHESVSLIDRMGWVQRYVMGVSSRSTLMTPRYNKVYVLIWLLLVKDRQPDRKTGNIKLSGRQAGIAIKTECQWTRWTLIQLQNISNSVCPLYLLSVEQHIRVYVKNAHRRMRKFTLPPGKGLYCFNWVKLSRFYELVCRDIATTNWEVQLCLL